MKNYNRFVSEMEDLKEKERKILFDMVKSIYDRTEELGGWVSLYYKDYPEDLELSYLMTNQKELFNITDFGTLFLNGLKIEGEDVLISLGQHKNYTLSLNKMIEEHNDLESWSRILLDGIIEFLDKLTPELVEDARSKKEAEKFNM